jgi:carboxyl-terminal processing protease
MARFRKFALLGVLVAVPVVASGFFLQSKSAPEGTLLLEQVLQLVSNRYVDTLTDSKLFEKAAHGLVRELNDPYSELLAPKDMKQFKTRTEGRYGGLGMLIEDQQSSITIVKVYRNTPAEAGGVREGDRIIQVDTLSTRGWNLSQVSEYLLGTPGTRVNVRFVRPGVGSTIDLKFTRAQIHIPAVPYTLVFDNKIGYLPLEVFNENAAEETQAAVKKLTAEGAKGIILDLRGNGGGILDQSVDIAKLFLKPGQRILSQRGRADSIDYNSDGTPIDATAPLIVLTDPYTASASEIVAGALQDHDRAVILGETSFGKGLVQSVYPLDGGYALKLTTAKWYTPSGRSIQRERKIIDGRIVDDGPDTNETEATKRNRPAYRSDAGRVIYGGGGITPDLIVDGDTLTTPEQQFIKTMAPKNQDFYFVLSDYSLELSKQVQPGFAVQPAWREEFYKRLQTKGATVDRKLFDSAERYVNRTLEQRVARFAQGDSTAKRRDLQYDAPLRQAISMLEKGQTQRDLFAIATAMAPIKVLKPRSK